MARPNDDDELDDIDIDLPFLSFRFGWPWGGSGWSGGGNMDPEYREARRRVRARLRFLRHLATYAAVMGAIFFIDWITGGGISSFSLWLGGIWGAFLIFQSVNTFVIANLWSRELEQRMIERELQRHGKT